MARWILEDVDEEEVERLSHVLGIPKLTVEILLRRGFESGEIETFLFPSEESVHDPYVLRDMDKAVDLLIDAWKTKRLVLIHGDYDVDGVTGAALLYTFMSSMGWNVEVYIPDRINEGYGVSTVAVEDFHGKGGAVVLTVDCGITAFESVELAKRLGMGVVITDHHEVVGDIPKADAVVNPRRPDDPYPFKELAGVGVAFKLVQALADRFGKDLSDLEGLLDLVALGTVADMVPLVGENRYYVKKGLKLIGNLKERPGLRSLLEKLMIADVRSKDISYKIAPRLNAAGRMGSAFDAFKLLITGDRRKAELMVETLINHNVLRQAIESNIFHEAIRKIEDKGLDDLPVIVVGGENWHLGVIGIVASRIASRYGKPAMVVSFNDGIGKGSARSVDGTNILEIFQRLSDVFIEFGGHTMAVGFTISRDLYDELLRRIERISIDRNEPDLRIDAEISLRDINPELFEALRLMEPFGLGNPEPLFLIRNLEISKLNLFDGGRSASLVLRKGSFSINASWHSVGQDDVIMIRQGAQRIDVVAEVEPDFFNPKLRIVGVKFRSGVEEMDSLLTPVWFRKEYRDPETELIERRVSELVWDEPWWKVIVADIRSRNYVVMDLLKRNVVVVSMNGIISDHLRRSLSRHGDFEESRFMTLRDFIREKPDVEGVVLNELQLFYEFEDHPVVSEGIKIFSNFKLLGLMTKLPQGIKPFLKKLGFKRLRRLKTRKLDFRIQDSRGREYRPSGSRFSVVTNDTSAFRDIEGQVYHHSMNRFQRISIVNLVKRGKIDRLIVSPNTDGLPVLLGGEVIYRENPLTPYEILDAVYPVADSDIPVLILNYSKKAPEGFEDELDDIYFRKHGVGLYIKPAREIIHMLQDPGELI